MITPSTEYSLHNASGVQDTVYALLLFAPIGSGSVTDPATGASVTATAYTTESIPGLTSSMLIMQRPAFAPATLSPLAGTSSIGSVSLSLLDASGAITTTRQSHQVRGNDAALYIGYRGMTWGATFLQVIRGKITQFERSDDGLSYKIEICDRTYQLDVDLFKPEDVAAEPYTAATKSFDDGSLVLSDADGDSAYDTVTLSGDPVGLFLRLALSGGDAASTDYNVWPAWAGLGLTEQEVDVAACEAEQVKVLPVPFLLPVSGAENGKSFIEAEFCKALGGYLLLSGQGKIRIHYPTAPTASAALQTLSDSVLVTRPKWRDSNDLLVTAIDYSILDGDGNELKLPRRCSPEWLAGTVKGEERVLSIRSRGLRSTLGGISIASATMDALFVRYGTPPSRVALQTLFSAHLLEAGDVAEMTSDYYPDIDGRGVGATRLLEVLSVKAGPFRVEAEAIDLTAPLTVGRRAVIGPAAMGDYTAATTDEKETYAWLADDATEELSTGDAAYIWS